MVDVRCKAVEDACIALLHISTNISLRRWGDGVYNVGLPKPRDFFFDFGNDLLIANLTVQTENDEHLAAEFPLEIGETGFHSLGGGIVAEMEKSG
jgi:hypothetical protein